MKKPVLLKIDEKLIAVVDYYCKRNYENRTSWISKAILDRLKVLGYDVEQLFDKAE
ncbi:MAG: hypothetical protein LBC04_02920 [Holosporaceae bacterium]|jgi:hypothetical protein|nr:hypothetical protein [Holosporaceae bacterium]